MDFLKQFLEKWRFDYGFKTFLGAGWSFLVTLIFAVYNGYLGISRSSIWHGSICVYYLLLSVIRGMLLLAENRIYRKSLANGTEARRGIFYLSAGLMLLLNLALIVPISLLVKLEKPVSMGLIPAIAMAAYTTYKVILASVNFRRKNRSENLFVRELRAIGLMDAMLSVITLQNTLITVNGADKDGGMLFLSASTSALLLLLMIAIAVSNLITGHRICKKDK